MPRAPYGVALGAQLSVGYSNPGITTWSGCDSPFYWSEEDIGTAGALEASRRRHMTGEKENHIALKEAARSALEQSSCPLVLGGEGLEEGKPRQTLPRQQRDPISARPTCPLTDWSPQAGLGPQWAHSTLALEGPAEQSQAAFACHVRTCWGKPPLTKHPSRGQRDLSSPRHRHRSLSHCPSAGERAEAGEAEGSAGTTALNLFSAAIPLGLRKSHAVTPISFPTQQGSTSCLRPDQPSPGHPAWWAMTRHRVALGCRPARRSATAWASSEGTPRMPLVCQCPESTVSVRRLPTHLTPAGPVAHPPVGQHRPVPLGLHSALAFLAPLHPRLWNPRPTGVQRWASALDSRCPLELVPGREQAELMGV
ncbi:uncharacterized protein LOC124107423 [Marmota monax]|uniref:uncharacterized protein LOC124107423 n=1 Tax=Marmota monax TaxID=9995 RepID=UPI0026ECAA6E|nr:uncharacterized protein LOC124107423 [Marmota monax]